MLRRLLICCLLLLLGWPAPHHPAAAQADRAYQIIDLVNQLRASLGLPPYQVDPALMAAAQAQANWMATTGVFSHTGEGGSRPQDRAAAAGYRGYVSENIVGGTNLSPQQGVIWWQNSPIHYQTMTATHHIHAGAGFATHGDQNLYVLVVGHPSDYAPPPSAPRPAQEQPPAPVVVTPVQVSQPREDGSIVHVVQQGQTAWDIAAVYDVDLETLLALNNLGPEPIILPGEEILVRPSRNATPTPQGPHIHVVQPGQTAWAIAARYGLSLDDLLWLNGLPPEPVLHPGDELIVRLAPGQTPPPTPTPPTTHVVQSGETAWSIAARYGLSLEELLALNGLQGDPILFPGDELVIRRPAPTATASPTLPPAYTALAALPQPTTSPVTPPTATSTATATPTTPPTPTFTATPPPPTTEDAARQVGQALIVGGLAVGVGLLALAGVVAAVGFTLERRARRGRRL